jgi:hypothetical protein
MQTYIATVRIKGHSVRTLVHADSTLHALLILQFVFGIHSIAVQPLPARKKDVASALIETSPSGIKRLAPAKPKTPAQQRIDSLKTAKDRASAALDQERKRQRMQRAQRALVRAATEPAGLSGPAVRPGTFR